MACDLAGTLIGSAWRPAEAAARMTIVYDPTGSLTTLIGVLADGSPGLTVSDGLYEQVSGPLPVDRKVGG